MGRDFIPLAKRGWDYINSPFLATVVGGLVVAGVVALIGWRCVTDSGPSEPTPSAKPPTSVTPRIPTVTLTPVATVTATALPTAAPTLTATPSPACPPLTGGHWSGTWTSTRSSSAKGTWEGDLAVANNTISGTVVVAFSRYTTGGAVVGFVSCDKMVVETVDRAIALRGTVASDGRSASGTYEFRAGDRGVWQGSVE